MGNCQSRICSYSESISETSVKNCASKRGRKSDKYLRSPSESVKSTNSESGSQSSSSCPRSLLTPLERLQRARRTCSDLKSRLEEALAKSERVGHTVTSGSGEELFLSASKCDSKNKYREDVEDNNSASSGSVSSFLARLRGSLEDLRRNPVCGSSDEEFDSALEKLTDYLPDWLISDLASFSPRILSPGEVPDSLDPQIPSLLAEGSICHNIPSHSSSISHPLCGPPSTGTDANRATSISDKSHSLTLSHLYDPPTPVHHRAPVRRHSVEDSVACSGIDENDNVGDSAERKLSSMCTVAQRLQGYSRRNALRNAIRSLEHLSRSIDRITCQSPSALPPSERPTGDSAQLSTSSNSSIVESTSLRNSPPQRWLSALRRSRRTSARVSPSPCDSGPVESTNPGKNTPRRWLSALRRSPRSSRRISPSPGKVQKVEVQSYDEDNAKMFCKPQPSLAVDPIIAETSGIERCPCEQASSKLTSASPSPASTITITSTSSFEFEEVIDLSSPALDTTTNARPAADSGGTWELPPF